MLRDNSLPMALPPGQTPVVSLARAWSLSGAAAVSVGFARFDYALILPAMKADLGLTYAQAGWLNTVNGLGYLLGALLAILGVGWLGNRRLFIGGVILTTAALVANGLTHDFTLLAACRFFAGLGGAGAFICGAVLAGILGGRAIAVFFGGAGLGVAAGGAVLPWLFHASGPSAWPQAWIMTGAVCAALSFLAIQAVGGMAEPSSRRLDASGSWRGCVAIYLAYCVFGLGYIAYMTFMIAWVRQHAQASDWLTLLASATWVVLGVAAMAAPALWRGLLARCRDGRAMSAALLVVVLGAALPLALNGATGILLSALLVGVSVLIVPSAMTHFIKANMPQRAWGSAMAIATSLFAAGQFIGPVACGWLSDYYGSLSVGLAASAIVLLLAAVLAAWQKALH
ncbi:YbfB/YjiJ family MFS transporter [Allopusillimonas soli]|uniref:YbfB/YjiJ family MFS transporter n=1 Tax=Allopusillimonas soli TaxID=659016 RepID=A0A853FD53_9BURK|nr:YbfB/YjiJ family MFS transporter [Allopusillimonas soli]NYT35996.1 YbfB/YjiJ family MFS transporter [Allopusillimonas soli]TEA76340.1 YbfB/YjiJ family MFS transporter [Allopusillimonas soli]